MIVVGLGNPGDKYLLTAHNVGFLAVEMLAKEFDCSEWKPMKKTNCDIAECTINGQKVTFAKPRTFMNESGIPVSALMKWYTTEPSDLIVIHDDTDLALGDMKIQSDRGAAGHNGVASIISHVGTKDFTRIRLGVRPEGNTLPAIDLVLQNISFSKTEKLDEMISNIAGEIKKRTS